jgi:hypothetical protein
VKGGSGINIVTDQTDGGNLATEGISRYRDAVLFHRGLGTEVLQQLLKQYSNRVILFNNCSSLLASTLTLQSFELIPLTLNNSNPASQKSHFLLQYKVPPVSAV